MGNPIPSLIMKLACYLISLGLASSFMNAPQTFRKNRYVVSISKEIANLIDEQLWRQKHKEEVEAQFQRKKEQVLEKELPVEFDFDDHMMEETLSSLHLERDRRKARDSPMRYCADRGIATSSKMFLTIHLKKS